ERLPRTGEIHAKGFLSDSVGPRPAVAASHYNLRSRCLCLTLSAPGGGQCSAAAPGSVEPERPAERDVQLLHHGGCGRPDAVLLHAPRWSAGTPPPRTPGRHLERDRHQPGARPAAGITDRGRVQSLESVWGRDYDDHVAE